MKKFNETIMTSDEQKFIKAYLFIKGFAIGTNCLNTIKSLAIAKKYHEGQYRKGGDPYIVHPLRVCSQLISLGFNDDIVLSASILHDIYEDTTLKESELVGEFGLPQEASDIIKLLTKTKNTTEDLYYEKIKDNAKALIIKLSDRCNNVSTMQPFTHEKMQSYIDETKNYILPLCQYGKEYYPEYSNAITIMKYHIVSLCEMVQSFLNEE